MSDNVKISEQGSSYPLISGDNVRKHGLCISNACYPVLGWASTRLNLLFQLRASHKKFQLKSPLLPQALYHVLSKANKPSASFIFTHPSFKLVHSLWLWQSKNKMYSGAKAIEMRSNDESKPTAGLEPATSRLLNRSLMRYHCARPASIYSSHICIYDNFEFEQVLGKS